MDAINDGGPAFPCVCPKDFQFAYEGLSKREWFAGQFMVAAASENTALDVSVAAGQFDMDAALTAHWAAVARAAFIAADAFLAASVALPVNATPTGRAALKEEDNGHR